MQHENCEMRIGRPKVDKEPTEDTRIEETEKVVDTTKDESRPKIEMAKDLVLEGNSPEEAYDQIYGKGKGRCPPVLSVLQKVARGQKKSDSDKEPEKIQEDHEPEDDEIPNEDILRDKVVDMIEESKDGKIRLAEVLNRLECERKHAYRIISALKDEDIICSPGSTRELIMAPKDKKDQIMMFFEGNRKEHKVGSIGNFIKMDSGDTRKILEEMAKEGKVEQTIYGEWKLKEVSQEEPEEDLPEEGYPEEKYDLIKNFVEIWKGKKRGFAKDELEQSSVLNDDEVDNVWEHLCCKKSPLTSKLEDELDVNINMSGDGITIKVDPLFD